MQRSMNKAHGLIKGMCCDEQNNSSRRQKESNAYTYEFMSALMFE